VAAKVLERKGKTKKGQKIIRTQFFLNTDAETTYLFSGIKLLAEKNIQKAYILIYLIITYRAVRSDLTICCAIQIDMTTYTDYFFSNSEV
jgi:hypothetical protein